MTGTTKISSADLEVLIARALTASRTSEPNALSVAKALTAAEIDGQKGHGLSRVPTYAAQSRAGKVNGFATPQISETRPGSYLVDVANGFAYPALDLAVGRLPGAARGHGIAAAGFTRSHHFGVAGHVVERLADHGMVALVAGNTPGAMAAWGGKRPLFGTNPIAFAAPQRNRPPIVVDLALSVVARGKILQASQKREPIPAEWALDDAGQPTTDAAAALTGTLRPLGGAKGAALALMVEILAAALTGSNFAFEASSFLDDKGGPPSVGQLLIAIDPAAFGSADHFLDRIAVLAEAIETDAGARLPGARRLSARERASREGIVVDEAALAATRALASG